MAHKSNRIEMMRRTLVARRLGLPRPKGAISSQLTDELIEYGEGGNPDSPPNWRSDFLQACALAVENDKLARDHVAEIINRAC